MDEKTRKERARRILDQEVSARAGRRGGYREQALRLLPWVCGSCGRDFEGSNLAELTVHHKDHDHTNNPPDGSNWELLCHWCHDNEHSRDAVADASAPAGPRRARRDDLQSPFAGLDRLLATDTDDSDS
ncbi:MAG: HNH nuclease family protein [Acidobacteria bacterium]|nr:HNH nuclease family protein [Acidobacteriota bacterium]